MYQQDRFALADGPRGEEKYSSTVAMPASAAPVKNAAGGDTRVQMAPKSTLAARLPNPSTAL
jgi:hypothetical protein